TLSPLLTSSALHNALPICTSPSGTANRRTGAAYIVAQDIKQAMNYTSSLNAFLRGLEQGEFAGQMKGSGNSTPLYVGTETIQTRSEEHTSELQSRENLVCR